MALKTFILKNSESKEERREAIQTAVRKYFKNDEVKVNYDNNGKATLENTPKKFHIAVTCANDIMMAVIYEKPIGIDGEYLPRIKDPSNKVDYQQIAERFFSLEESEFLRSCSTDEEKDNFVKIWVRKEAYTKAVGKTVAEFPNFSVIENDRYLPKVNNVSLKKFSINFPGCEDYLFVIAGVD